MQTPEKIRRHVDLRAIRERLGLTQDEFAALLGFSRRTVQSCEQGWRQPSPALEKAALLLLISQINGEHFPELRCWENKECSEERRSKCIAYCTRQGHLCWFLTGTLCGGERVHDWPEKRELCLRCSFFEKMLNDASTIIVGENPEGPFVCPD